MRKLFLNALASIVFLCGQGQLLPAQTETFVPHPAVESLNHRGWCEQLGQFEESVVRGQLRALGFEVFDLNVDSHRPAYEKLRRLH